MGILMLMKSEPIYAEMVNVLTLASLLRKNAITLKGNRKRLHVTKLGTEMYLSEMQASYLEWKQQLEEARAIKREMINVQKKHRKGK